MRIALYHNAPSGGAKRAIYEWARRLSAQHEIDVYSLSTADHDFCDIRPYVQQHRVFPFAPGRLYSSPLGRLNQWQRWRDLTRLSALNKHIAVQIDNEAYDVLFAHTCQFTFIPSVLRFAQTPSAFYLHEPFGHGFVRDIQRPWLHANQVRDRLDRVDPLIKLYRQQLNSVQVASIAGTELLIANSGFTQGEMQSGYRVQAPVCHYGVNCESFHPIDWVQREDFVLSVGEMSPRKGFDFLVQSLAHIPVEMRPRLRLACNRVDSNELLYVRDLSERLNVELEVLSNLDTEELNVQYNKARICLYAPVLEPFGLVPLEAMAAGTAVVGVDEGGVRESVVDGVTGQLVEREAPRFAQAVQRLLQDPSLCEEYGYKGREQVLKYWTWDHSVSTLEQHLNSLSEAAREAAPTFGVNDLAQSRP